MFREVGIGLPMVVSSPSSAFASGSSAQQAAQAHPYPLVQTLVAVAAAALALMLKAGRERYQAHRQMVDALDARMAARNLHTAVNQQMNLRPQAPDSPVTVHAVTPATTSAGLAGVAAPAGPTASSSPTPIASAVAQTARPAPIHVRPAQVPDSVASPGPRAAANRPRVVLVRTRPAPGPRHRAAPKERPAGSTQLPSPTAQAAGAVLPAPALTALPQSTEPPHFPPATEVQEFKNPEPTEVATSTRRETELPATKCGSQEQDALCQKLTIEAQGLGFSVESAGQRGENCPATDLLLKKGSVAIAVEVSSPTLSGDELADVKRHMTAGLTHVAVVCPNSADLKKLAEALHAALPLEQAMKVSYYTPEEFSAELQRLAHAAEMASKRTKSP